MLLYNNLYVFRPDQASGEAERHNRSVKYNWEFSVANTFDRKSAIDKK